MPPTTPKFATAVTLSVTGRAQFGMGWAEPGMKRVIEVLGRP